MTEQADKAREEFEKWAVKSEYGYIDTDGVTLKQNYPTSLYALRLAFEAGIESQRAAIADKDAEIVAARRTSAFWKDELIAANKEIEQLQARVKGLEAMITRIVAADKNNTEAEPSVSVLGRTISEAAALINPPGEQELK